MPSKDGETKRHHFTRHKERDRYYKSENIDTQGDELKESN